MFYILILLLIPVFFVGIVIFTCTLVDYVFSNNLDVIFLMIGLFGTLISSFFILKEVGLIKKELDGVKVLGSGELTKKLTVKANKFTKSAREKIENIGGKIEVI